ncbi:hypothetical protein [Pedobacter nyackensis]|uniref:hypothetical protein n=1 Tax=Pedobacter nyackensis TaxID=475255 RepID=UPI00292FAB2A|nr:hypothetical protein [Pedobacter nyackensis]
MNELIQLPQYDLEGIRIPDSAVYWWHNTTKDEQDNIRLKMQVDMLIQANTVISNLAADLKPTIKFFGGTKTDEPTQPKKRISKKERERLEFEAYEKRLELKALNEIKNGGK